jgi:hypothetical protein
MRAAQKSSIATAVNIISKLFVVAIAVAATAMAELRAGSAFLGEEATPASGRATKVSLTVKHGRPSGTYTPGSQVLVHADAAPIGTKFLVWAGDVEILADPASPTTTATIPFTAVTLTATYGPKSIPNVSPLLDAR